MGIKKRNLDEQHIFLQDPGPAVADAEIQSAFAEFDYFVKNVYVGCAVGGITGATVVDINKDGTTIFDDTVKATLTATVTEATAYDDLTAGMEKGDKGDRFSFDIDSIHSGTAQENTFVHIVLTRKEPQGGTTPSNVAPSAL